MATGHTSKLELTEQQSNYFHAVITTNKQTFHNDG